ncbi:hypothetical protein FHR70_003763 [Microvirga lupini]|uniref:Uncharacterized protein n=1 Tax=Microvirga lupini TaxID=420324 RepID=A0A7W4YXK6_9HYPH|nr:hypothetical protein [Microvirga lupini]MBB3020677.1 hypothetical protein [Microvirga lupini]
MKLFDVLATIGVLLIYSSALWWAWNEGGAFGLFIAGIATFCLSVCGFLGKELSKP